jgi:hypothetical protein
MYEPYRRRLLVAATSQALLLHQAPHDLLRDVHGLITKEALINFFVAADWLTPTTRERKSGACEVVARRFAAASLPALIAQAH